MPRMQHSRRSDNGAYSVASLALTVFVLIVLTSPALCDQSSAKRTARPAPPSKQLPKCAPTDTAPAKDPPSRLTPIQADPQSLSESQAQGTHARDSQASDSLKLESVQKDGVEISEPECAPGQTSIDGAPCQAVQISKDKALQCVRDAAQKPDLAIDSEPRK